MILGAAALVFAAAAAYAASNLRGLALDRPMVAFLAFAALAAGAAFSAWRLRREAQLSVLTTAVSVVVSLYIAEPVAFWWGDPQLQRLLRGGGAVELDARTGREVVQDLRRAGRADAVSYIPPAAVAEGPGQLAGMMPLAGIGRRPTVICNETGQWLTFDADERGFRNPPGAWSGPVDVALVGDSFIQGLCLPEDATIAGRIRAAHPRTLNLGYAGNSPLMALAGIREYLAPLKPRVVVWAFYEGNDFKDLAKSLANPILARYLSEPGFRQNLAGRQAELDAALAAFAQAKEQEPPPAGAAPRRFSWLDTLLLRNLRGLAGFGFHPATPPPPPEPVSDEVLRATAAILARAKAEVEAWGGTLVFAYLPHIDRYLPAADTKAREREFVLRAVGDLDMVAVDLVPAFTDQPDPTTLWVYRSPGNHYNDRGYGLAADAMLKALGPLLGPASSQNRN